MRWNDNDDNEQTPLRECDYVTMRQLKKKGWTPELIRQYLTPIKITEDGRIRTLYSAKEAEEVSRSRYFKESRKRKAQKKRSYEERQNERVCNRIKRARTAIGKIQLPTYLEYYDLRKRAIDSYNQHIRDTRPDMFMQRRITSKERMNIEFEKRIMRNYVRHNLMPDYEYRRFACHGECRDVVYYSIYKSAVMEAIYSVYDYLRPCDNPCQAFYDEEDDDADAFDIEVCMDDFDVF